MNPGHSEECNAYIISVNNIELCSNDKTLNIKDNDLIQKLYDIIEDKLYDYLDDEVYEIIIRDMEDYYGYIEYQRCKYDERMDDR